MNYYENRKENSLSDLNEIKTRTEIDEYEIDNEDFEEDSE